jgi:hypothetical protein
MLVSYWLIKMKAIISLVLFCGIAELKADEIFNLLLVFGPCILHVYEFPDSEFSKEVSNSIAIGNHGLPRITYNYTHTQHIAQYNDVQSNINWYSKVSLRSREICSVHIFIGLPIHGVNVHLLPRLVNGNLFAVGMTPPVTILLVPENFGSLGNVLIGPTEFQQLPPKAFAIELPSGMYYFFCSRCYTQPSRFKRIPKQEDVRLVSESTYKKDWRTERFLVLIHFSHRTHDIWECDSRIWREWRVQGKPPWNWMTCSPILAYWDLQFQSVEKNLTGVTYIPGRDRYRQIGRLISRANHLTLKPRGWFECVQRHYILYYDCTTRSQTISLEAWTRPYKNECWISAFVSMIGFVICLWLVVNRGDKLKAKLRLWEVAVAGFKTMGILFRQGTSVRMRSKGIILVFCFSMFLFTTLYENLLTSEIISPDIKRQMNMHEYLATSKRTAYAASLGYFPLVNASIEKLGFSIPEHKLVDISDQLADYENVIGTEMGFLIPRTELELASELSMTRAPFSCQRFAVDMELPTDEIFVIFLHGLSNEFIRAANILRETGMYHFWQEVMQAWRDEMDYRTHRREVEQKEELFRFSQSLISLKNLIPLFIGTAVLEGLGLLVFVYENTPKIYRAILSLAKCLFRSMSKWKIKRTLVVSLEVD